MRGKERRIKRLTVREIRKIREEMERQCIPGPYYQLGVDGKKTILRRKKG